MSFSISLETSVDEDVAAAIDRAIDADIEQATANNYQPNVANARKLGMIEVAKQAVSGLAADIARPGDRLSISLYGHANPSKDPEPGWASNTLTISVSQAYGAGEG